MQPNLTGLSPLPQFAPWSPPSRVSPIALGTEISSGSGIPILSRRPGLSLQTGGTGLAGMTCKTVQ